MATKTKKTAKKREPAWITAARKRWESEGDPDHVKATTSANWIEKTKDPIGG